MAFDIPPRRLQILHPDVQQEQFEKLSPRLTAALRGLGIGVLGPEDDEDQPLDAQPAVRDQRPTRH